MKTLLFLLLLLSQVCLAQKSPAARLEAYLKAQEKVNGFSGVVLVTQKGKTLYRKAFGMANREWAVPNTIQTRFRTASITKQFTAAAILQLVAARKLSLTDPLSRFYPGFPKGDSVTVHMLLNHTSGIRSFVSLPEFSRLEGQILPKDSIIALFRNQPYDFTPGSRYAYNNSAYFLLGTIVEKVSGQSYESYLSSNFFNRLGLPNTCIEKTDSVIPHFATGYRLTSAGWKRSKPISMAFPFGSGDIVSTADDLYQWQQALRSGAVIPNSLFSRMTTPYLHRYGYALDIDSLGTHQRIGHDGNIAGFGSYCYYYPSDDLSMIVLSNKQGRLQWFGQALAALVFGMPVLQPYPHQEIPADPARLPLYAGTYQTPENSRIEIICQDGRLYHKAANTLTQLKPEAAGKFFWTGGPDYQLHFETKPAGLAAFLIRDGLVSPLKKLP